MNRHIFGRDVQINELLPFSFTEHEACLTPLDFSDAVSYAPFNSSVIKDLKTINIRTSDQKLDHLEVPDSKECRGAWAKRLAKHVKVAFGYNLDAAPLSVLSERITKTVRASLESLYIEFTDHANWKPGEFGDDGSCWWGSVQNHSRIGLIERGGGAIRLYNEDKTPRGRMWYFPINGGEFCAVFNIYDFKGNLTMLGISRLISMKYDVTYTRAKDMHFPNSYFNGNGSAYLVGLNIEDRPITMTFARKIKVNVDAYMPDEYTTPVKKNPDGDKQCYECEEYFPEGDMTDVDGNDICEECLREHYFTCEDCDNWYHTDHATYIGDHGDVCDNCINNYSFCDRCEEHHRGDDYYIEDEDRHLCLACFENGEYFSCYECGDYNSNNIRNDTDNDGSVCNNCAENHYTMCAKCNKYTKEPVEVLKDNEQVPYCDDCYQEDCVDECPDCHRLFDTEHDCEEAPDEEE